MAGRILIALKLSGRAPFRAKIDCRFLFGALGAAFALGACAKKIDGEALYAADSCRQVTIVDQDTGEAVVGAEDLVFDAVAGRVIISAYDRRLVEREARKRAHALAQGGVYAVPIDALKNGATALTLQSIVARESVAGGLRPHGIAFDETRREIAFVNRSYQQINGKWRMTPRIERTGADGAVFIGDGGRPRCSANDVALDGDRTYVSFDHAACGWRGGLEDIANSRASGVDLAGFGAVFDGARHANGIVRTNDAALALAATRDSAVFVLQDEGGAYAVEKKISLPGAPDNLTVSRNGSIVAALYPSLAAIGAQRRLGLGRSASRIVRIDPETGETTTLFDDPSAKLFSAASAAIEEDGLLIAGSALDRGVLVCSGSAAAP